MLPRLRRACAVQHEGGRLRIATSDQQHPETAGEGTARSRKHATAVQKLLLKAHSTFALGPWRCLEGFSLTLPDTIPAPDRRNTCSTAADGVDEAVMPDLNQRWP